MQTAALIVAAGMSSRMGQFKPMMPLGSISVAQRVIATLHQAGIRKIVMVTGYQAETLERHLSGSGIIFLRNEHYASTQMFDSAKIGLAYLQDKCDRVLFTPVDIPLFTAHSVQALMNCEAPLARLSYQGRHGHPILIGCSQIPQILQDRGDGGLRGALRRCSGKLQGVPVDDPGILLDADTPEDFSALVSYHNSQLVRPVVSVSLHKETLFFDSKIALLLTLIDETKSVRTAGQRMQLSYSSCWNIIRTLENQIQSPLITRTQGGPEGSTSTLTAQGKRLLECYSAYEQRIQSLAADLYDEYFGQLFLK